MFKRLWLGICFVVLLGTYFMRLNALSAEEPMPESAFEDWVVDKSRALCRGLYRQPDFSDYATQNPSGQTTITANSAEFMVDGPSIFRGNIFLQQPGRQVQADFAKIYRDESTHRFY